MITFNAAKILGINKDYGSIKVGKSATFFISKGDVGYAIKHIRLCFHRWREISLESHQTKLWQRYLQKIRNKN